jgi:hypothetical protein
MTVETPKEIEFTPIQLNPATTAILAGLSALGTRLDAIRDTLERREFESPGLHKLATVPIRTSLRFRVTHFIIAVSAAGVHSLRIGTSNFFTVETAGADTLVIPLPVTIDNGVDISVVSAALTDAFILGYTDYPEGER